MNLSSTSGIQVESSGNDVSYVLPVRPLGGVRWVGVFLLGFGVLFVSFPARQILGFARNIAAGESGAVNWIFLVFLIPFVIVGLLPAMIGLLMMFGRCRVDLRDGKLSVLEYAGPIRWRRRLPTTLPVRTFKVTYGGAEVNNRPVTTGPMATMGALTAEYATGKPRMVVMGYPRDLLEELAGELSARLGSTTAVVEAPRVEVLDAATNRPEYTDVPQKPPGSLVTAEHPFGGVKMSVPKAGLWKGSKGMFFFGILWCLFMTVFTSAFLLSKGAGGSHNPFMFLVFISAFWLIGLGMLAGALNMGLRRATLVVDSTGLSMTISGPFGTKVRRWRRGEIAAVRADASNMEVNNKRVIELQIHPAAGRKVGLLAGRDEEELRWIATELRQTLKVPAKV